MLGARSYIRTVLAIVICLSGGSTLLSAKPTKEEIVKASHECDAEHELAYDNCMGGGWEPNECLETAAVAWRQCMRRHGIEQTASRTPPSRLRQDKLNDRRRGDTVAAPNAKESVRSESQKSAKRKTAVIPTPGKQIKDSSERRGAVSSGNAPAAEPSKPKSGPEQGLKSATEQKVR